MEVNQSEKKEKTKQLIYNYPCSSKSVVGPKNLFCRLQTSIRTDLSQVDIKNIARLLFNKKLALLLKTTSYLTLCNQEQNNNKKELTKLTYLTVFFCVLFIIFLSI